ncbi:MAG: hypothetical protein WBG65_07915 [Sulfurimonadaceae bacterium]
MQRISLTIFFLTLLSVLSGCQVSSLTMPNQKQIVLNYNESKINLDGKVVKNNRVNLSPAMIYQSVFQMDEGGYVVYENVDLDLDYRYSYGTERTIDIIFDAKRVRTHFRFNNLHFYQAELKNSQILNVLVQQSDDQTLTFVYGFSSKAFQSMIDTLKADDDTELKPLKADAMTFSDPDSAIVSQWIVEMLVIEVIFVPAYRMMR